MDMNDDTIDQAVRALRSHRFQGGDHLQKLQEQLLSAHGASRSRPFVRRHRLAIFWVCGLVFAGSALAAGTIILKAKLYDIQMSRDGEVISSPRIIVEDGQAASITVSGPDLEYSIEIDPDGVITYDGPEDVEVDVVVEEVEVDQEPTEPPPADEPEASDDS